MAAPVLVVAFCSEAPTTPEPSLASEDSGGLSVALHDGNTIHACKKNQSGDVRLVDDPDQCLPSETLVEWGVQGPAGPSGIVDAHLHFAEETSTEDFFGVTAECTPGEVALGGGYQKTGPGPAIFAAEVLIDAPQESLEGELNAWLVFVNKEPTNDAELTLRVWVICAPTGDGS
ncbi:MAG: hypothetical protein ACREMK_09770 [Gemmatimonadota bacterium]